MGETAKSRAGKILLVILLASILAISIPPLGYQPNSTSQPQGDTGSDSSGSEEGSRLLADPSASPRPVNETAVGTATSQPVNLTQSVKNITATLPPAWSANSITTIVYNLWDQRNWTRNGNFTSDSSSWSFSSRNVGSYSNIFSSSWSPSLGGRSGVVYGQINGVQSGSYYYYDEGDRFSWNQTVGVPRGSVISARIEFKYYIDLSDGQKNLDAEVYAWVGNARVSGIEYSQTVLPLRSWHSVSWDVSVSTVTTSTLVSVGHKQLTSTGYGGISSSRVYFDDVRLIVKAYAKPDQLNMKMKRGAATADVTETGWGNGTVTLTGFTIGPLPFQTSYQFSFTSNVSLPAKSEFYANATIVPKSLTSAPSTFVNQGSKVAWTMNFETEFDSDNYGVINTNYRKYYFNMSVPSDWNYTTCTDPDGKVHNVESEADNFTITTIGLKDILLVNVTNIGSYSNFLNDYDDYVIHAESLNYIKEVWTQHKNGGSTYTNATVFYPENPENGTRVASYIEGAGGPVSSGNASLTIWGPTTYNGPKVQLNYVTGVQPDEDGFANFTIAQWNSTNPAGNYTAQVDWVDNDLGEAGSLSYDFNIYHRFNLTITFPAVDDVIKSPSTLSSPPMSVKVRDYYTGESIAATVKGKAKWEDQSIAWHQFSLGGDVGLYTNSTIVYSGLAVDSQVWLAANASKLFYDLALANSTVYIGADTAITPSSGYRYFHVRFTESQSYYVSGSFHYYIPPSTPVNSSTLTLLADASTNNTVVNWNSRVVLDLSSNGTGDYAVTIYMFAESAGGIPSGSYDVWFKLSKGTHLQTQTFRMWLQVDGQPSVLSPWTGNGQSLFWGDTALVQMNFTTQAAGQYDWLPFVSMKIRNDSYYTHHSYVTVSFGIKGWAYNWTVKTDAYPGTYDLYFDTRQFPNPTPGTGTKVEIDVMLHKASYDDPTPYRISFYVKSLTTCQSVVPNNTTTTSTYPRDVKTILVWYNDTHVGGKSTGIGGATVNYTSSGGNILGQGDLAAVAGKTGLYNLTLTGGIGGLTDKLPATYYLYVRAGVNACYVTHTVTVTLVINPLTSSLDALDPPESIYYLERQEYRVWYNDTHNNVPISGATFSITAPGLAVVYGGEVPGFPGLYNVTIPSGPAVGHYSITLHANKTKYTDGSVILALDIIKLPTSLTSYVIVDGSVLVQPNATIRQGAPLTIYMWFNETLNNQGVGGAQSSISFSSANTVFGNGWVSAVAGNPGLYNVTFLQTPDIGTYTIGFAANFTGYDYRSFTFTVTVYRVPTALVSHLISGGVVLVQSNVTIAQGGTVTIYLWFNNTESSVPIGDVEQYITYDSSYSGFGHGYVYPVEDVPGLYYLTLEGAEAGVFTVTFTASVTGYQVQSLTFTVNVQAPPGGGFSAVQLAVMGATSGGAVLAIMLGWVFIRRARIPFVIKKINESLKLIGKGDHEGATPVALKSREETIVGITQERIQAFSKRKPAAGEPEAVPTEKVPEVAAAAAPTAEVEAALKKELKAVEAGKPEEEIEEVEMETLDEELGRLEKIDTGQEVPEGAKQARDVIDEYKKRKKKR